jgi:hypothetical protein
MFLDPTHSLQTSIHGSFHYVRVIGLTKSFCFIFSVYFGSRITEGSPNAFPL